MTDITAILNVHREGILAHASLGSIRAAREVARAAGIKVEILVVADCPDVPTLDYFADADDLRLVPTEVDDLGLARNRGVEEARGEFVAFLDGDDLWGASWLRSAFDIARREARSVVWHPEGNLFFGTSIEPHWLLHPEMEEAEGDWVNLGIRNHWTALSFGARRIYRSVPYRRTDLAGGFGYEDWSWNSEVVAQGHLHRPVPGTAHMIRVRGASLLQRTVGATALVTPSSLLRSRIGWARDVGAVGVATRTRDRS
jgi:glycosyltransferase involved in cell wall biosynthesis